MKEHRVKQDKPVLNRLNIVLAEQNRTGKWLAAQLKTGCTMVSRWRCNLYQPSLETLNEIARILGVDPRELVATPTKSKRKSSSGSSSSSQTDKATEKNQAPE